MTRTDRNEAYDGPMGVFTDYDSSADAVTDFAAMLDRERDEAFREHLRDDHGYVTTFTERLLIGIANTNGADCETCERYAESVGTEE